jgi:hypothetical protein
MPIVITPSGEYVDSVTGNPVQMTTPPMDNMAQRLSQGMGQRNLDSGSVAREGEMIGGAVMPQIPDPMSVVRSEEEMLYLDRLKAIKEMDPGAVAREGEDVVMERMFPGSVSDPRSVVREGERATAELSDVDKVRMLIDMGLNPQEAMEAIAREKARPTIAPEEFGRVVGMEGGQQMADPMMREQQMGALPMARPTPPPMPMQRPFDLSNMSPEQRDMVRRGIDPFAEGMMGR